MNLSDYMEMDQNEINRIVRKGGSMLTKLNGIVAEHLNMLNLSERARYIISGTSIDIMAEVFGGMRSEEEIEDYIRQEYPEEISGDGIDYTRTVQHHLRTSWQELAAGVKDGTLPVEVGASVTCELTDGTPAEFVVTDVKDQYVRFESRNFIGGMVKWNNQDTTKGGYPDSGIRGYIDSTIWELLPEDLQAVISDADRVWKDTSGNCGTYVAKLFLPAASEVFDEDDCYGDKGLYKQLDYYKDARNRIRVDENGEARFWWLASVRGGNSAFACFVKSDGDADCYYASDSYCVPVCFQISKIS